MEDDEFESFIETSFDNLEKKQNSLEEIFGLGHFDRYDLDVENEIITFSSSDDKSVKANFIPIGTFSPDKNSWMWAWNNQAFTDSLRAKSKKLQSLSDLTGFEMFTKPTAEVDEDMAWEMVAMSVHVLKSQGVYRALANNLWYFYALDSVGE
jgi:hypothetical protein